MSVSDTVLAARQLTLKSIFEQHSAYLNSRWFNDEHFTVQTRMLEPGPRWRKEPPASFLMMLLRDRELANFQTPPGYHGLLSQVSSSKFQQIVDWLHAVLLEAAAQQEARPFEESHSFSQVPEALPFPISAQSGIPYSPTAPGRSITETIGSLPSTPPYQGAISFSMEDPRAVIQRILHPVSHYLNIWALRQSAPNDPMFPPPRFTVRERDPLSSLVEKLVTARQEAWFPCFPPPPQSPFNLDTAISNTRRYEELVAWLEAVVISISKINEEKRSRRLGMDGSLPSSPISLTFPRERFPDGISDKVPRSADLNTVRSHADFVASTPPIPTSVGSWGSEKSGCDQEIPVGAGIVHKNDCYPKADSQGSQGFRQQRVTFLQKLRTRCWGSPGPGEDTHSGQGHSIGPLPDWAKSTTTVSRDSRI